MELEESGDGSDMMLADNTMDGLQAPPELPFTMTGTGAAPNALPQVAETPQQAVTQAAVTPYSQPHSVFPGNFHARTVFVLTLLAGFSVEFALRSQFPTTQLPLPHLVLILFILHKTTFTTLNCQLSLSPCMSSCTPC